MKHISLKQWFTLTVLMALWGAGPVLGWEYTMPIGFEGYDRAEALVDFPALVVFSNNVGGSGFDYEGFVSDTGGDLRFMDGGMTTELAYEIEQWDTNGTSLVWVRVPELTSNTVVRALWGAVADAQAPAYTTNGAVWNANHVGVWHLGETGTATLRKDSTANAFHATPYNFAAATTTNGVIGGAVELDGVDQYLQVANQAELNPGTQPWSVSFWAKLPDADRAMVLISKNIGTHPFTQYAIRQGSGDPHLDGEGREIDFLYINLPSHRSGQTGNVADGTWRHVTVVADPALNASRAFIDGELVAYTPKNADVWPNVVNAMDLEFGRNNFDAYADVGMDEIRIENTARSTNWVRAAYQNQAANSQFNIHGAAKAGELGVASTLPATNVTAGSAWLNGELHMAGDPTATVRVHWGQSDKGASDAWDESAILAGAAVGPLSHQVGSLAENQIYYYRFSASNTAGMVWSSVQTFATAVVTVEASLPAASKADATAGQFTLTRPAAVTNAALTVHYTMSGSANNGVDYTTLGGTAEFPAGETQVTLAVTPIANYRMGALNAVLTLTDKIVIPGNPSSATVTIAPSDDAPDPDWEYDMSITFEGYTGSETLTNFPALVVFSNNVAGSGFKYTTLATATGADLWFVDANGIDLLLHEIQSWDTNGVSYAWVQIPELTSNTVIEARWGSPVITTAPAYTTNGTAWAGSYKGVWHLAESSGTRYDSTANNHDGTVNGNLTAANGVIGTGLGLDGADGTWLGLGQLYQEAPATLEMWFNLDAAGPDVGSSRIIWTQEDWVKDYYGGSVYYGSDTGLSVARDDNGGIELVPAGDMELNRWYHMAMVYHGTTASVYLDGVYKATSTETDTVPFAFGGTAKAALGRKIWGQFQYNFSGIMDEVRLASVERSAAWIKANYDTQITPVGFGVYGNANVSFPAGTVILIR